MRCLGGCLASKNHEDDLDGGYSRVPSTPWFRMPSAKFRMPSAPALTKRDTSGILKLPTLHAPHHRGSGLKSGVHAHDTLQDEIKPILAALCGQSSEACAEWLEKQEGDLAREWSKQV